MTISVQLINSIIVEENNINLGLSLYLHTHSDNRKQFIYYSDYLGYGMTDGETYSPVVDTRIPLDSPKYLSDEEYKKEATILINQMNNMSFKDVLNMLNSSKA